MGSKSPVYASWWNSMLPQLLVIQVISRHTAGLFDLFIGRGCVLTSFWGSWRGSSSSSHRSNLFRSPDRAMLSNSSCRTALIIFSGAHLMICSHQNPLEHAHHHWSFWTFFWIFWQTQGWWNPQLSLKIFVYAVSFLGILECFFYFPQAVHMNCWSKLTVSFKQFLHILISSLMAEKSEILAIKFNGKDNFS